MITIRRIYFQMWYLKKIYSPKFIKASRQMIISIWLLGRNLFEMKWNPSNMGENWPQFDWHCNMVVPELFPQVSSVNLHETILLFPIFQTNPYSVLHADGIHIKLDQYLS